MQSNIEHSICLFLLFFAYFVFVKGAVPLSPVQETPHQSQLGSVCLVHFVLLSLCRKKDRHTSFKRRTPIGTAKISCAGSAFRGGVERLLSSRDPIMERPFYLIPLQNLCISDQQGILYE